MRSINEKEIILIVSCMRFTESELKKKFGTSDNAIVKDAADSLIYRINKVIEKLED